MLTLWAFKHVRHERDAVPALLQALDLVYAAASAPSGLAALGVLIGYIYKVTGSRSGNIQVVLDQLGLPR